MAFYYTDETPVTIVAACCLGLPAVDQASSAAAACDFADGEVTFRRPGATSNATFIQHKGKERKICVYFFFCFSQIVHIPVPRVSSN